MAVEHIMPNLCSQGFYFELVLVKIFPVITVRPGAGLVHVLFQFLWVFGG